MCTAASSAPPAPSPTSPALSASFRTWSPDPLSVTTSSPHRSPSAHTRWSASRAASPFSSSGLPKRSSSQTLWAPLPTPYLAPDLLTPPTPGSELPLTRFRSTSTSAATPTWPSASAACSASTSPKLRLALSLREHHGLLAPLAHLAFHLASRLPLHPARRQPERTGPHLPATFLWSCSWGALARRELDFLVWGAYPRHSPRDGKVGWKARALRPLSARRASHSPSFSSLSRGSLPRYQSFRRARLPQLHGRPCRGRLAAACPRDLHAL